MIIKEHVSLLIFDQPVFSYIKNFLKKLILKISNYLIVLSCFFNYPFLTALILRLNLRINKHIKYKKIKKRIIVLEKSFGIDDLNLAFKNTKSDILFLNLQRSLLRNIFNFFFKKYLKEITETNYLSKSDVINQKKNIYKNYLSKVLKELKKLIKFEAFLSFNLFYLAERELQRASFENSINFLVCHKESVSSEWLNIIRTNVWKKKMGPAKITKVAVYNNYIKKALINSNSVESSKIEVTGMPRADIYFKKKRKNLENKFILFLMIEENAQLPLFNNKWISTGLKKKIKPFTWKGIENSTFKVVTKFAREFKDEKFIFKTKPLTSINKAKEFNNLNLSNCKLIDSGGSVDLIRNSKIVIAFNTTGILEALLCNIPVITPEFGDLKEKKNFILNFGKFVHNPKSEIELFNILVSLVNKKKKLKKIDTSKLKKLLIKHIGNSNGASGKKLRIFLKRNI